MSDILSEDGRTVKSKTKDSVFTALFRDVNNVFKLYQELHPEDTVTTVDDIEIDTLETILINDIYNDLGFLVHRGTKAKYIMLVEAQSKWTENITLRILFYLAESYRRYLISTKQSEHSSKRVYLPEPELYVIYTGNKKVSETISLKNEYFSTNAPLDLSVNVITMPNKNTLNGQYIAFCKVYDKQRKIYKEKLDCIRTTLEICIKDGYLREFLKQHEQEVVTMLSSLFDEQAQRKQYDIAMREEVLAEGRAEGRAEGEKTGRSKERDEIMKNTIISLKKSFPTLDAVVEMVMDIFKLDRQTATAKVSAYWN